MVTCHVKDCRAEPVEIMYLPAFQTVICFCFAHSSLPIAEKSELTIDLVRARSDHQAGLDAAWDRWGKDFNGSI